MKLWNQIYYILVFVHNFRWREDQYLEYKTLIITSERKENKKLRTTILILCHFSCRTRIILCFSEWELFSASQNENCSLLLRMRIVLCFLEWEFFSASQNDKRRRMIVSRQEMVLCGDDPRIYSLATFSFLRMIGLTALKPMFLV